MSPLALWLVLLLAGLLTYALRLSFIAGWRYLRLPPLLRRALRFVPVAVLVALIVPDLLRPAGSVDLTLDNHRLIAGLLAMAVAWRTRNVLLTIGVGMAALLVLQAIQ